MKIKKGDRVLVKAVVENLSQEHVGVKTNGCELFSESFFIVQKKDIVTDNDCSLWWKEFVDAGVESVTRSKTVNGIVETTTVYFGEKSDE